MDNHRKCKICAAEFPVVDFPKSSLVKGKQYYRHECVSCYTKIKTDRKRKISLLVEEYKKNLCCAECGNSDFRVLEFHHNGDDKEINIGDGARLGWATSRIEKEIKKCEVLCANCHRILHWNERKGNLP